MNALWLKETELSQQVWPGLYPLADVNTMTMTKFIIIIIIIVIKVIIDSDTVLTERARLINLLFPYITIFISIIRE